MLVYVSSDLVLLLNPLLIKPAYLFGMESALLTGYEDACWKGNIMAWHRLIALNYTEDVRFVYKLSEGRYCGFPTAD